MLNRVHKKDLNTNTLFHFKC